MSQECNFFVFGLQVKKKKKTFSFLWMKDIGKSCQDMRCEGEDTSLLIQSTGSVWLYNSLFQLWGEKLELLMLFNLSSLSWLINLLVVNCFVNVSRNLNHERQNDNPQLLQPDVDTHQVISAWKATVLGHFFFIILLKWLSESYKNSFSQGVNHPFLFLALFSKLVWCTRPLLQCFLFVIVDL